MDTFDKQQVNEQVHQMIFLGKGECLNYAGDYNDAFLLVRALEEVGWKFALFAGYSNEGLSADFCDREDNEVGRAVHKEAPMAICLAALEGIRNAKLTLVKK